MPSSSAWPESVERVGAALREAGAESRIEEFPAGTQSAEDAARAVGCELRQIVKSLVFDCDGRSVIVMVPGDRRADSSKVAEITGAKRAPSLHNGRSASSTLSSSGSTSGTIW